MTTELAEVDSEKSAVPAHEARFQLIWQQIQKHNAVLFLRHALRVDMTLAQLQDALTFQNVIGQVEQIRLKDVLQLVARPTKQTAQPKVQSRGDLSEKARRRKRRGPEELQELRDAVLARMRAAVGSVSTSHLCEVLGNGGFEVDLLQMNRMLNSLETDGYLLCLGGKPKKWRMKPQGRTAPEPMMVVRRNGQPV